MFEDNENRKVQTEGIHNYLMVKKERSDNFVLVRNNTINASLILDSSSSSLALCESAKEAFFKSILKLFKLDLYSLSLESRLAFTLGYKIIASRSIL